MRCFVSLATLLLSITTPALAQSRDASDCRCPHRPGAELSVDENFYVTARNLAAPETDSTNAGTGRESTH